jgi:hypothetical protein
LAKAQVKILGQGYFCLNIILEKFIYCVLCKALQENKVELFLQQIGYKTISIKVERNIIVNGKTKNILHYAIPGYVFFESENLLDGLCWREICKMQYIFFLLKYPDNKKTLCGKDL